MSEPKQISDEVGKSITSRGGKYETVIIREICDFLHEQGYFFWRQNTIPVFNKGAFRAMPKYSPRGLPDIMILYHGLFITLEVKSPGYWKHTDEQKDIGAKIVANGGYYHVVTSIEEAKEAIYQSFSFS